MSLVLSYSVGNGDMFSIRHNSDNFTIIDCCMSDENWEWILADLKLRAEDKGISRFISTHPDEDHMKGLFALDQAMPISNFYCVSNQTTKDEETEDFKYYCSLRDGDKAFYISKGCSRKWMNISDDVRGSSGIQVLWPVTSSEDFIDALEEARLGGNANNISPVITYSIEQSAKFMWMGDLETDFLEAVADQIQWPEIDILFAPHHGRDSGKIPEDVLALINPKIIIIGEAPSEHLNYYSTYNTITQNSAGSIAFECLDHVVNIFTSSDNYSVDFLSNYGATTFANYIGSLDV